MKIRSSSHPHTVPGSSTLDPVARLRALAESLEAGIGSDGDHPPTLVAVRADPPVDASADETFELLVKPLSRHPAAELEGFVAPPSWWCIGVVASGRARTLERLGGILTDASAEPFPVHVAHLVTRTGLGVRVLRDCRTGEARSHVIDRRPTATPTDTSVGTDPAAMTLPSEDDDGETGLLDDYLHLALRLSTPPPPTDTAALFGALWVHRVMPMAVDHRLVAASWDDVAHLHPVFDSIDAAADPALDQWTVAELARAGEIMAQAHPWRRVRAACQLGIGPLAGAPADLAGWLDDGAFARLAASNLAPMSDLLADLHHLVPPGVHRRLLDTVAAWGLLA